MSARGHAPARARPPVSRAASVFRVAAREEALALDAVKRLAARSPGRAIDDTTREELEEAFGCDFARVRIHTDDAAAEIAELLDADAVTIGKDIFFAEGEYRPGDATAEELLAHELAHVAEQRETPTAEPQTRVAEADEPLEQLAEALGREAVRDEPNAAEMGALVDRAAHSIALRATRKSKRPPPKEPSLPLGDMRIVERLAGVILGDFWKDPDDKAGRVRNMLRRLGERTHAEVLEVINARLADADKARFVAVVNEAPPPGSEVQTPIPTADDSSREQRQERDDEESAATRNRDPSPQEAEGEAGRDHEARAPEEEQGPTNRDEEEDTPEPGAEAEGEKGEGEDEEKTEGGSIFQKLGDAFKKAFGLRRGKKKRKKPGKRAEKRKGEEKAEKQGEKPPQKPALEKGGKKEGEGGEEKPEGAEVETQKGAGETERPSAGGPAEGPVDTSPIDRLLARSMRGPRGRQRQTGLFGAATPAGVGAGHAAPTDGAGAEAKVAPSSEATGSDVGGAEAGSAHMPTTGSAPDEAATDHDSGAESQDPEAHAEEVPGGAASGEQAPTTAGDATADGRDAGEASGAAAADANAEAKLTETSRPAEADAGAPAGERAGAGGGEAPVEGAGTEAAADAQPAANDAALAPPGAGSPAEAPETDASAAERSDPARQGAPEASVEKGPERRDASQERAGEAKLPAAEAVARPGAAGGAEGSGGAAEHASEPEASSAESGGGAVDVAEAEGGEGGAAAAAGPEAAGSGASPDEAVSSGAAIDGIAPAQSEGVTPGGPEGEGEPAALSGEAAVAEDGGDGGDLPDSGGGGGGGGSAIEDKPEPAAPDTSQAAPADAMAAMAGLPPGTVQSALGGVGAASEHAVSKQRDELAQSPPQVQRPSGAPADHAPTADPAQLAGKLPKGAAGKVGAIAAGKAASGPAPPPPPELGAPPKLPSPAIPGDGPLEQQNLQALQSAVTDLPTTDPALHVSAGQAPKLVLAGDADPNRTTEQRAKNEEVAGKELRQGATDAAQPMGEDAVYPHSPPEMLKAEIPQGETKGGQEAAGGAGAAAGKANGAAGGGGGGGGGADADAAASIVAGEQHGDDLNAQINTNSGEMRSAQEKHDSDAKTQKDESQKKVDDAISDSAKDQELARRDVKQKVAHQRAEWTEGQSKAVKDARDKGDRASADSDKEIAARRAEGEQGAQKEVEKGDADIAKERQKAERTAREQRQKAKEESDGFFGWIGSKVKSFFNKIKQAISDAFDAARSAIKAVIKKAQELAVAVIDAARNAIVAAIKVVGEALIEIGNVMLAAFPELREKFKKAIHALVDKAIKAVDALADALKKTVVALLNLLGKALDALLGLLLAALKALVDAVATFVKKIIAAAKAAMQALGAFWALIKDIAANPGQWIRNLGAAVVDGIKNHLIKAFKSTIKKWFNDTVESVIGVGKAILDLLRKGGITFAMIVKMAWEAMKAAIPPALIQLLVEKLVAMIVPAAGALMTIIEGVKAAWGTIQQIIAAFETFFKFLKAVKGGGAGPLFAQTLAAAAIVVIQFVAQWLLGKLKGAGGKVGGKLREIAQKILRGLKKGVKAVGAAAKRVGRAIVRGVKKAIGLAKKGAAWVGGKLKKGAAWVGAKAKKAIQTIASHPIVKKILNSPIVKRVIAAVRKGVAKVKAGIAKAKQKFKDWREKRRNRKKQKLSPEERLQKAVARLRPRVHTLLRYGVRGLVLRGALAGMAPFYGLRSLRLVANSGAFTIVAKVNPETEVAPGVTMQTEELLIYVQDLAKEIAKKSSEESPATAATDPGAKVPEYDVNESTGLPALLKHVEGMDSRGRGTADILSFKGSPGTSVFRQQGRGDAANKVLYPIVNGKLQRTGLDFPLAYPDIGAKLATMGSKEQVAGAIRSWVVTRTVPEGMDANVIAHASTLMFVQEAHRNPRALVYAAMTTQSLAASKDMAEALERFPMSGMSKGKTVPGAVGRARSLTRYLERWKNEGRKPHPGKVQEATMMAEVEAIKFWIKTLDLKFEDESKAGSKVQQLKEHIRRRMFAFFNLSDK